MPNEAASSSCQPPLPAGDSASGRGKRFATAGRLALAMGATLAAVALAHHPMLRDFRRMQTDPGDTRLNNYLLEHSYRWVRGDALDRKLWSPPFFYPADNSAARSDLMLGLSPLYWMWRWMGRSSDRSMQLWMMTMTALNCLSAYALLRWGLRTGAVAAAAGGLIFAIGSPRIAQVGHQALLPHVFVMTALLAVFLLLRGEGGLAVGPRRGALWVAVFFASLVLAFYTGFYTGFFLVLALAIAAVWASLAAVARPAWRRPLGSLVRRQGIAIVLGAALAGAAMIPWFRHYLAAAREAGPRPYAAVQTMLARPQSWIHVGRENVAYGWTAERKMFQGDRLPVAHEQQLGVGFVTAGVVLIGLLAGLRRRGVLLTALTGATLMVLATTFTGRGEALWRVVYECMPGGKAIRAPCRVGLLLLVPAAVGVALFVDRALRAERRFFVFAAGFLLAVCAVEQVRKSPTYDKLEIRRDVARIASRVDPDAEAFFVTAAGSDRPEYQVHLDAMWASLQAGKPTVNGYSGSSPKPWRPLWNVHVADPTDEERIGEALKAWASATGLDASRVQVIRDAR